MKRRLNWLSMAAVLVFAGFTANATLLVEDHFNYATTNLVGNTPAVGGTWGGNNYAGIASGSLTSPAGFAAASGNKVTLGRTSGAQTNTFTTQSSGTVYISYLAQFNNLNGKAFLVGGLSSLGGSEYAQLEYSNVTGNAYFKLGLGGRSTTLGPLPTNQYAAGTTHLIVVSYEFVSGTANDIMKIWIDPDSATFGGTAPAPYQTMTGFTDAASLNTVDLKSGSSVPADSQIDELRVGTSWADVTPVQIQTQTITFPNPGTKITTDTVTLTASASSGLPVTYAVVSGSASLNNGSNITFSGSGSVTLSANQAGNGSWNPAPQTNVTFTVTKATAAVTLNGLSQTYDGASKPVTATTTPSGKTVDITYDGSATAPVNAGSYTVVGTVNDTMYQGGATGTLVVAKANQTLTFTNPGNKITTDSVSLSATASSGLSPAFGVVSGSASIAGSTATFTGAGSVTLSANQAGNSNWNVAAQTNVTFTVSKATATVTLSNTNQIYNGSAKTVTVSTAPSGLTVDVTYNGSATPPSAAGSYAVVATVNDAMYQGSASGTLLITSGALNVRSYSVDIRDVWTNGTVRFPGTEMRVGQQTDKLSAGVMAFELPDLNGATIIAATLNFRVNAKVSAMTSNYNCNVNIEAIRSGPMGSATVSNDYRVIGLRAGEASIQDDVAVWTNSVPRDYQTIGAATNTLGAWLADQYDNVGIGGVAFLRLAPDRDPSTNNASSYYYSIPTDSISLTITTAGDIDPVRGFGNTVSARIGADEFSWTFDRSVEWGHFIDGMPWVVIPSGGLYLTAASPARLNNQLVPTVGTNLVSADINITVRNPPFDHTFNGTTYFNDTNGVFGWDGRTDYMDAESSCNYNPALGWSGSANLQLAGGDSITTPKSIIQYPMPARGSPLGTLAVLTVLTNIPPDDAFRPGVIRSGTDRTSPEILRYSSLIDLSPYVISNPVGRPDLRGTNVTSLAAEYTINKIRICMPGPGFLNTGMSKCEGAHALYNECATPDASNYGADLGNYMGRLSIGSLASWLTDDERKLCRTRLIQRAIDTYSAVKAGVCMEEGAGMEPGWAPLITIAGIMMNHTGMKSVNQGVNGVKPWHIFADYATCVHTDGISTNDLVNGEGDERLISIFAKTELNKTNQTPIAAVSATTMTMKTNYYWTSGRPIGNVVNYKFRITGGAGAGSTIYVITNAIVYGVTDAEKFRKADGTLFEPTVDQNQYNFCYGGKVGIKPTWQNGTPNSSSVLAFSTGTSDSDNILSDDACWYWQCEGVNHEASPVVIATNKLCITPIVDGYSSVFSGASVDLLIALYALGGQDLYKAGLDKYLFNAGMRAGYGEVLFQGSYFGAVGSGSGNTRGALWKQEVLNTVGATFQYTCGTNPVTSGALDVPHAHAKMWYEP